MPVRVAQVLFFINAAIWLLIGAISLFRISTGNPATALVIAILMLGNVGAMLAAGLGLGRRPRLFYHFGIAVLAINILLTITDEFGMLDFITLMIDVALLGLLIATRSQYRTAR
jgi:hypothetical protein